jgi:hypothetical protein
MANYYNGQPTDSPMGAIWLQAAAGIGGSIDATHAAATRYPNGVGLGIVGTAAGGTGNGWNVGIQLGGSGGGWEVATSKLGQGINIRDYTDAGIFINTMSGSAGRAIVVDDLGGHSLFGDDILESGSDFTAAKVSVMKSNSAFGTGSSQGNTNHLALMATDAQAANVGASMILGGKTSSVPAWRGFGLIRGAKTNGTNADSSGYLLFATNKTGVGMVERMRIDADGVVSFPANAVAGGFLELNELTGDVANGAANTGRLYLKDNGASKTQLMVRFASGAAVVIATEP